MRGTLVRWHDPDYIAAALLAVPAWLVLRAWLTFLAFLIFPPHSKILKILDWMTFPVSLPAIRIINLLVCVGGIVCPRFRRKSAEGSLPLRKAIGLASG